MAIAGIAAVIAVVAFASAVYWLFKDVAGAAVLAVAGLVLTVCAGYLAATVINDIRNPGGR